MKTIYFVIITNENEFVKYHKSVLEASFGAVASVDVTLSMM